VSAVSVRRVFVRGVLCVLLGVAMAAGSTGCAADIAAGLWGKPKGYRVTVTDSMGEVALREPARHVVALDWAYAEDLLAVGLTPAGVVDPDGYLASVGAGPRLPTKVAHVGTSERPAIGAIRDLHPDLIITGKRPPGRLSQLREVAPLLVFDSNRADMSAWEEMRTTFQAIATAVGRSERGAEVLSGLDTTMAGSSRALSEAGVGELPLAIMQGSSSQGIPRLRIFTRASLVSDATRQLGLQNAWRGRPEEEGGFTPVEVAALAPVARADLVYVSPTRDDPFAGMLAHDAEWTGLDFVMTKRVHALGSRTYYLGGPLSMQQYAVEIVRALT
jgi:ferric hydroxamate transport system substrate-binding protein